MGLRCDRYMKIRDIMYSMHHITRYTVDRLWYHNHYCYCLKRRIMGSWQ